MAATKKSALSGVKIYVAGSSKELVRVEMARDKLSLLGAEVLGNWISEVKRHGGNPPGKTSGEYNKWAAGCMTSIDKSDYVLALIPHPLNYSLGLMWELGYCHGTGKYVVIDDSYNGASASVFTAGQLLNKSLDECLSVMAEEV